MHNKHRSISVVKQSSKIDLLLVLHCLIGFILFIAYKFSWIAPLNLGKVVLLYSFLLNLLFIFGLHKRLQSWVIYIQWLLVAYISICSLYNIIARCGTYQGIIKCKRIISLFDSLSDIQTNVAPLR